MTSDPDQGRRRPRRRADRRPARATAPSPRSAPGSTADGRRGRRRRRAGRAARPGRPAHPPARARPRGRRDRPDRHPRPRPSAASPPCTPWPTPTRSPTPPASSSRSGGSAARPATATSTRSAPSPSGLEGEQLAELGAMADSAARVRVFSDDGKCVSDAVLMRRALEYVKAFDGVVAQHAQEPRLTEGAQMNEGELSGRARPGRLAGGRRGGDHRPRLPARRARRLPAARLPRLDGRLGRDRPLGQVARAGTSPPRSPRTTCCSPTTWPRPTTRSTRSTRRCAPSADVEALREALADGTIDCVATDHAPHPHEDKDCEWAAAAIGHARPRDRALGRPGDDGRHRAARLGRRRRPDVLRARPGSAGWPTTAGRSRSASPPTSCSTTRRCAGWSTPASRPR